MRLQMNITFTFPESKFARDNTITEQVDHVQEEINETVADICYNRKEPALLECIDVYHASETLIRILIRRFGEEKVKELIEKCYKKNNDRGYYD